MSNSDRSISASRFLKLRPGFVPGTFASMREFIEKSERDDDWFYHPTYTSNLRLLVLKRNESGPVEIGVVLYDTIILAYRNDETFTADSGGYPSVTTCTRMSQFAPEAYRHKFHVHDRTVRCAGYYAERHANRFAVNERKVIGPVTKPPKLKRKTSKNPHGRIRFFVGNDEVISINNNHPQKIAFKEIIFDSLPKNGSYNADFDTKMSVDSDRIQWKDYEPIDAMKLPLDLVNDHRKAWGMPVIKMIEV